MKRIPLTPALVLMLVVLGLIIALHTTIFTSFAQTAIGHNRLMPEPTAGPEASKKKPASNPPPVSFRPATNFSDSVANALAVGDFNGDGNADFALLVSFGGRGEVFLGDGLGGFAAPITFNLKDAGQALAVGDFNGDGKLDLAVGFFQSYTVTLLFGDGTGKFDQSLDINAASYNTVVIGSGDFNGDGRIDLVVAGSPLTVLLGNDAGTFSERVQTSLPDFGTINSIAIRDFNHDGKMDIAISSANEDSGNFQQAGVIFGDGTGKFGSPVLFQVGEHPTGIAAGDLNGDGNDDLVVSNRDSLNVTVFMGDGHGAFASNGSFAVGSLPRAIALADFNNDGILDLVTSTETFNPDNIIVAVGTGDGNFKIPHSIQLNIIADLRVSGDFNNDGRQDLAIVDRQSKRALIVTSTPNGGMSQGQSFLLNNTPGAIEVGDFNKDGKLDLAVSEDNALEVLLGDGAGNFAGNVISNFGNTGLGRLIAGDFNNDGNLDLIGNGNQVGISLGDGHGGFQIPTAILSNVTSTLGVADFNNDGKLDFVFGSSVYLGNGNGTFAAPINNGPFGSVDSGAPVFARDFNGDGNIDVIVGTNYLIGNGQGKLTRALETGAPTSFIPIGVADFDGDGKLDIVGYTFSFITILKGDGIGGFTVVDTGIESYSFMASDMTGDSKADLAIIGGSSTNPRWLSIVPNDGKGNFAIGYRSLGGAEPIAIGIADFNNDGRPDIVTANSNPIFGSVLINSTVGPDLQIQNRHNGPFLTNTNQQFILTISNVGGIDATGTITVTDTLPPGVNYLSAAGKDWNCGNIGQVVTCTTPGPLPVGVSKSIAVTVNVTSAAVGTITNTATVSNGSDGDATDNTAVDTVTVLGGVRFDGLGAFTHGNTSKQFVTGDFDGDGLIDAAVPVFSEQAVSVMLGDGPSSFGPAKSYSAGSTPSEIFTADFNGDGLSDLLTTNNLTSFSVLLADGSGGFGTPRVYKTNLIISGLQIIDVNGDGHPDLFIHPSTESGLLNYIFLGDGLGAFGAAITVQADGAAFNTFTTADFNNDGKLDIAALNFSHNIAILLGDGKGAFHQFAELTTIGLPLTIDVADFNLDGKQDLLITSNGQAQIQLGEGTGGFHVANTYSPAEIFSIPIIADFNNDGIPDVMFANPQKGNVLFIMLGDGAGGLSNPTRISSITGTTFIRAVDYNRDGKMDLVVQGAGGEILVFLGDGHGGFNTGPGTVTTDTGLQFMVSADFNGDGRSDIASVTSPFLSSSILSIYLANPGGGLGVPTKVTLPGSAKTLSVGDFNKDGKQDLAYILGINLHVLLGDGAGGFGQDVTSPMVSGLVAIKFADFNNDGNLDLVAVGGVVHVALGDGHGGFTTAFDLPILSHPTSIAVADFDNDGKPDIVVADAVTAGIRLVVLKGDGAGNFTKIGDFNTGCNTGTVFLAMDFNKDNNQDLFSNCVPVLSALSYLPLTLLPGDGSGGFGSPQPFPLEMPPSNVFGLFTDFTNIDINGDGIVDLVGIEQTRNTVKLLFGDGKGHFPAFSIFNTGGVPNAFVIGDFNGDGKPDIAVINGDNGIISVLLNQNNGPDLSVSSTHTGAFKVGTVGEYTLTVSNIGGAISDGQITVTDTLPAGLSFVSATGPGWNCNGAGQTVNCVNSGSVLVAGKTTISLKVNVSQSAVGAVVNNVSIANSGDTNPANNSAQDPTSVVPACAFSILPVSKSFDANGGQGSVNVTVETGCAWVATSNAQFITVDSGSAGNGAGTVQYTVAANSTTNGRTGTITIAGLTFTVNQSGLNPLPSIDGLTPSSAIAGGAAFNLTVNGHNFIAGSVVRWNGSDRGTTFGSSTQLSAAIPASDLSSGGSAAVRVINPAPGGGTSNILPFAINKTVAQLNVGNLIQTYDGTSKSVTVTTIPPGLGGVTVTYDANSTLPINAGSYAVVASLNNPLFQSADAMATLTINKSDQTITFSQIADKASTDLPFLLIATATSGFQVTFDVTGPISLNNGVVTILGTGLATITAKQDGSTNFNAATPVSRSFNIVNLAPTLASISPNVAMAGAGQFQLVANGNNFAPGATIRWNGNDCQTTVVNSAKLLTTIPGSDVATIGTATVTVFNPAPAGGLSLPINFRIVSLDNTNQQSVDPGGNATVSNAPLTPGQPGITAELTRGGNGIGPSTISVGTYTDNPTPFVITNVGGGFVDLKVISPANGDSVNASFYYPSTITGAIESSLKLLYFNGSLWKPVRGSGANDPGKDTTDNLDGTISGGRFVVLFDETSTPKLSQLSGTVFTFTRFKSGDIDGNGVINVQDLLLMANILAGNTQQTSTAADVNEDGKVDVIDLLVLANFLAGNIHELPVHPNTGQANEPMTLADGILGWPLSRHKNSVSDGLIVASKTPNVRGLGGPVSRQLRAMPSPQHTLKYLSVVSISPALI